MHLDGAVQHAVRDILTAILPADVEVFAYGSRIHGRCLKPFSDLDLCLRGPAPVPDKLLQQVRDALEDSNLSIKVDVVDWHTISEEFRTAIRGDLQPFLGQR
jgi:uncharacterized protein